MTFLFSYIEQRPPADIASWVACFWQIVGKGASGESLLHRVLPDGCADLVFDIDQARSDEFAPTDLVGPMSGANLFELRDTIEIIGVRLRPGAIGAFGGIPAGYLLDSSVPLTELPKVLRISNSTLAGCENLRARFALLADICRRRAASLSKPDPLVGYALAKWSRPETSVPPTVSALIRDIGLSERAFERRFVLQVGLRPVHYRRLARFRAVLRLYSAGARDWANVATLTGFSDQSHLVREFRTFAGLTPTEWAATQSKIAGFLQDGQITTV